MSWLSRYIQKWIRLANIEAERDALVAKLERVRKGLGDLFEDGCSYGDNCPPNTNHYQCKPCAVGVLIKELDQP